MGFYNYEITDIYSEKNIEHAEKNVEKDKPFEDEEEPKKISEIETKYDWERKIDDYRHDWYEILELQELDIDSNYSEALKTARKKINALLEMGIAKGYITPEEKDIISGEFAVTQDQERKI